MSTLTREQLALALRSRVAEMDRDRTTASVRLEVAQARLGAWRDALDLFERLEDPSANMPSDHPDANLPSGGPS